MQAKPDVGMPARLQRIIKSTKPCCVAPGLTGMPIGHNPRSDTPVLPWPLLRTGATHFKSASHPNPIWCVAPGLTGTPIGHALRSDAPALRSRNGCTKIQRGRQVRGTFYYHGCVAPGLTGMPIGHALRSDAPALRNKYECAKNSDGRAGATHFKSASHQIKCNAPLRLFFIHRNGLSCPPAFAAAPDSKLV